MKNTVFINEAITRINSAGTPAQVHHWVNQFNKTRPTGAERRDILRASRAKLAVLAAEMNKTGSAAGDDETSHENNV